MASFRWQSRTRLGIAHGIVYSCQEEASIAVLQEHVSGKAFDIQPRNIASEVAAQDRIDWSLFEI